MQQRNYVVTEEIKWVLGSLGTLAGVFMMIWWKVETRQDKKIDDMHKKNGDDHKNLHDKIDRVRDKVEEIWKHLVQEKRK
jgi:hypothetical protein